MSLELELKVVEVVLGAVVVGLLIIAKQLHKTSQKLKKMRGR